MSKYKIIKEEYYLNGEYQKRFTVVPKNWIVKFFEFPESYFRIFGNLEDAKSCKNKLDNNKWRSTIANTEVGE